MGGSAVQEVPCTGSDGLDAIGGSVGVCRGVPLFNVVLTPFSVACDFPFLFSFVLRRHWAASRSSAVISSPLLPSYTLSCCHRHLSAFLCRQLDSTPLLMSSPESSMPQLSSSSEIYSPSSARSTRLSKLDLCRFLPSSLAQLVHIFVRTVCTPPFVTMANSAVLVLSSLHLSDLRFSLLLHLITIPPHSFLFWIVISHDHYASAPMPHMLSIPISICLPFLLCSSLSLQTILTTLKTLG